MARIKLLRGPLWNSRSMMRFSREKRQEVKSSTQSTFQALCLPQNGVCEQGHGFAGLSWGAASLRGSCSRNDDTYVVGQPSGLSKTAVFGVFDGHGLNGGCHAAKLASKQLHRLIYHKNRQESKTNSTKKTIDHGKVLEDCFVAFDRNLQRFCSMKKLNQKQDALNRALGIRGRSDFLQAGTCAVVVLVGEQKITIANLGDSQAISNAGKLTRLHQCCEPDEVERIRHNGGFVSDERLNGRLMPTRAFGDFCFKRHKEVTKQVLSCLPEVTHVDRHACGEFLVLGTDGIFDVLPESTVMKLCHEHAHLPSGDIARKIVDKAIANGSLDNVTCVVIRMAPLPESNASVTSSEHIPSSPPLERVASATNHSALPPPVPSFPVYTSASEVSANSLPTPSSTTN